MENQQPGFVSAPMLRIPQIPPQQVAARRGHTPPALSSQTLPQSACAPQQPPKRLFVQPGNIVDLPQGPYVPPMPMLAPHTPFPKPEILAALPALSPESSIASRRSTFTHVPATLKRRKEQHVSDALMGCGILLVIGVIALVVLYYLTT